jgi:CubicO group peptidase (beta-lactamase class C family)
MREHVLQPAGMTSSTFEQQLPPALAARAATGTRANGQAVPGKWHLYPELAPDGLWTTPTDLAKFAIEVALSRDGHANHILSQSMTKQMLTVQCHDTPGDIGGIAMGFGIGYRNHPGLFRHTGGNDGFESILMMDADAGWGLAMTGNSDNFEHLENPLAQTLASAYGYDLTTPPTSLSEKLVVVAAERGIPAALAFYQREKTISIGDTPPNSAALNGLGYYLLAQHRLSDAISVFSLNVSEYPADANTYDSLAEAYLDNGQRDLAIQNYQKSLELNPKNDNAIKQLKKLRDQ